MDVGGGAFETRYSRSRTRRLLVLPAVLVAVVALAWWGGLLPPVVAVVLLALTLGLVLTVAAVVRTAATYPVALRIDGAGLTLPGCPPVPWSDVEAVEVGPLRPAGLLGPPRLVAAVLPRPGVRLPGSLDPRRRSSRGLARLRQRRHGTELVVPLFVLEAEPDAVVAAIETRGLVPVRRLPARRSRLGLTLLVVGAVLVAAFVVLLLLALLWMGV